MSEDLRIAYELEADILQDSGLLLPNRCACRFEVVTSYPGRPWYFVRLTCRHSLRKQQPNLSDPARTIGSPYVYAWFTGSGDPVSYYYLCAAYDAHFPQASAEEHFQQAVQARNGAEITRHGGVYHRRDGVLRYDDPR